MMIEYLENLPFCPSPIYDTHAHYDFSEFAPYIDELLRELKRYGIGCIINNAIDLDSSAEGCLELSKKYDFCYSAIGVHPGTVEQTGIIPKKEWLIELCKHDKVVAVGEIGLDYHYSTENKAKQLIAFKMECDVANELGLPVIIHDREAHGDVFDVIREFKPKGTIHCYSGSAELALKYVDMGLYIGVGGVVTFKNARKLVETVEAIPLESILLETDAPYLSPVPFRSKRCNSAYIYYTAEKIAEIKKTDIKTVLEITADNARKLYKVKP